MKKSIYLVEDDKEIRELIRLVLEPLDVEISFFETVTDFKKQFGVLKPDLLVLDVMLPDGSGVDICESVKSCSETADIPVLIMSAVEQNRISAETCHADGFIAKPFDIVSFSDTVQRKIA